MSAGRAGALPPSAPLGKELVACPGMLILGIEKKVVEAGDGLREQGLMKLKLLRTGE